jgi:hypothetical protein
MENTYTFKLPIGDWSSDGHGMCDYFLIRSNVPLEEVREAYLTIVDKLGTSLDSGTSNHEAPFSDYEDSKINSEQIAKLGLDVTKYKEFYKDRIEEVIEDKEGIFYEIDYLGSEDLASIFLDFMTTHAPHITLELISENHVELFPFYGSNKDGKHIGQFGYGLFSN